MKHKVQAQRKFAAGAYIPPSASSSAVLERRNDITSSKEENKNVFYNNMSASDLIDLIAHHNLHDDNRQLVVLLERLHEIPTAPTGMPHKRRTASPASEQTDEDDRPLRDIAQTLRRRSPRKPRKRRRWSAASSVASFPNAANANANVGGGAGPLLVARRMARVQRNSLRRSSRKKAAVARKVAKAPRAVPKRQDDAVLAARKFRESAVKLASLTPPPRPVGRPKLASQPAVRKRVAKRPRLIPQHLNAMHREESTELPWESSLLTPRFPRFADWGTQTDGTTTSHVRQTSHGVNTRGDSLTDLNYSQEDSDLIPEADKEDKIALSCRDAQRKTHKRVMVEHWLDKVNDRPPEDEQDENNFKVPRVPQRRKGAPKSDNKDDDKQDNTSNAEDTVQEDVAREQSDEILVLPMNDKCSVQSDGTEYQNNFSGDITIDETDIGFLEDGEGWATKTSSTDIQITNVVTTSCPSPPTIDVEADVEAEKNVIVIDDDVEVIDDDEEITDEVIEVPVNAAERPARVSRTSDHLASCVSVNYDTLSSVVRANESDLSARCANCVHCSRVDKVRRLSTMVQNQRAQAAAEDVYEFTSDQEEAPARPQFRPSRVTRTSSLPSTSQAASADASTSGETSDGAPKILDLFPLAIRLIIELTPVDRQGKKFVAARLKPRADNAVHADFSLVEHEELLDQILAHVSDMLAAGQFREMVERAVLPCQERRSLYLRRRAARSSDSGPSTSNSADSGHSTLSSDSSPSTSGISASDSSTSHPSVLESSSRSPALSLAPGSAVSGSLPVCPPDSDPATPSSNVLRTSSTSGLQTVVLPSLELPALNALSVPKMDKKENDTYPPELSIVISKVKSEAEEVEKNENIEIVEHPVNYNAESQRESSQSPDLVFICELQPPSREEPMRVEHIRPPTKKELQLLVEAELDLQRRQKEEQQPPLAPTQTQDGSLQQNEQMAPELVQSTSKKRPLPQSEQKLSKHTSQQLRQPQPLVQLQSLTGSELQLLTQQSAAQQETPLASTSRMNTRRRVEQTPAQASPKHRAAGIPALNKKINRVDTVKGRESPLRRSDNTPPRKKADTPQPVKKTTHAKKINEATSSTPEPATNYKTVSSKNSFRDAPVFYPTEEEFTDPLAFFGKISSEASKYGLCKVVAPPSFRPTCALAEDVRFNVANQYLARLYCRWGVASREMCAIKAYLAEQKVFFTRPPLIDGIELNLPKLYRTVQQHGGLKKVIEKKRWARVADDMRFSRGPRSAQRIDHLYVKHLLPYDTLSSAERRTLLESVERSWRRNYARMVRRASNPLHRQKRLLDESESSDSDEESDDDVNLALALAEAEDCVVAGRNMKLGVFKKVAKNVISTLFTQQDPTPEQVEEQYWQLVGSAAEHVCVNSASIDTGEEGYGFTRNKGDPYHKHPWNLKMLSQNSGNVLRSLGAVLGVTVPTLHLGMVLSTSCWHRDPHGLPWVEYLHTGPAKIWYGIPDELSSEFRSAVEVLCPTACQNKSIWLPSDITMIPPHLLADRAVPLSRVVQRPGEFIVVFPKAYSSSISTGYTQSESVYFATRSWLEDVANVFQELRDSCEPTMFSLEQLLLAVAQDPRSPRDVLEAVLPTLRDIKNEEIHNRNALIALGAAIIMPEQPRLNCTKQKKKPAGAWNVREQDECEICRTTLYLSKVTGLTNKRSSFCLQHALRILEKRKLSGAAAVGVAVTTFVLQTDLEEAVDLLQKRVLGENVAN